MYKLFILVGLSIFIVFGSLNMVSASNQNSNKGTDSSGTQGSEQKNSVENPTQNQNQVKTQNAGEEQQLQVNTQEKENSGGSNADTKGKGTNLEETKSSVAQQIQKLLETQSAQGGIGEQVREWAKSQNQSQQKIQEQLKLIENKSGLLKALFGTNYGALNELKQELNQNQQQLMLLEQLKSQLTNQSDITNVEEMITLLQQENTALQEKINTEDQNNGLLGSLLKLFIK